MKARAIRPEYSAGRHIEIVPAGAHFIVRVDGKSLICTDMDAAVAFVNAVLSGQSELPGRVDGSGCIDQEVE